VKVEREAQDRLHADVCAGDPTAWSRTFTTLLSPLVGWLGFKWPDLRDSERLHDFAVDSIIGYLQAPDRYEPTGSSLLSYLRMDAHRDLLNEHARLKRARDIERHVAVEIIDEQRKGSIDEYPSDREPPSMTLAQIREAFPDARDRRAVLLLLQDERSTEAFAEVWDVADLPPDEQFAAVKRNKDRVKARIRRLRKSA
jgi:RNA polymerase sigma-70 factor (ECF subfamily)